MHRASHPLEHLRCTEPRTAQMFLCLGPDGSSVDVINVHAPSGTPRLTDAQRKTLLRNLLQSNSESSPGHTIGTARFVICGDMNTAPHSLSQMLQMPASKACCKQKHKSWKAQCRSTVMFASWEVLYHKTYKRH